MPEEFNKNFIPQKRVDPRRAGLKIYDTVDSFTALALILFSTAILFVGGIFASRMFVGNQITSLQEVVTHLSSNFNPIEVDELVRLDRKVQAASIVLKEHTSITDIRDFLEEHTQSRVQIQSYVFEEKTTEGSQQKTITITGEALNYNTLANQQTIFENDSDIVSVSFTDMNPTETGFVEFTAHLLLTDSAFAYNVVSQ